MELPAEAKTFAGGTLYIRLQDTSEADAPAITLLESVTGDVEYEAATGAPVQFELHGEIPSGATRYTVRAFLDLDRDGKATVGDYVSVASYPVVLGAPLQLRMKLELVG